MAHYDTQVLNALQDIAKAAEKISKVLSRIEPHIATVEAEPVRHGSWGACEITGYDGLHPVYTRPCSECGYRNEYLQNYCPNCGAKMDAE